MMMNTFRRLVDADLYRALPLTFQQHLSDYTFRLLFYGLLFTQFETERATWNALDRSEGFRY